MIAFLDSTTLAALYIAGPDQQAIREAVRQHEAVAMATISQVHFMALLDALEIDGVPKEVVLRIGQQFCGDAHRFVKVNTEDALLEAATLAVRHHLAADQAVQLAAALLLERQLLRNAPFLQHPVVVVTLDATLAAAAQVEGLRIA